MAKSACIKCGGTVFEMVQAEPRNSGFIVHFVQCGACGGVVGVLDYYNIGGMLEILAKNLGVGNIH